MSAPASAMLRLIGFPPLVHLTDVEGDCRRTMERVRKAEQRTREALGRKQLTTEPHHARLIDAILKTKVLTEIEALDKRQVERIATAIIDQWADVWLDQ